VLHLVGRGDVGLEDPVCRYLPAFAGPGKTEVTVRQLLTHTSGLPDLPKYYEHLRGAAEVRAGCCAR
jgi:CubicO group peptidase (beta-lactamase class C family)